MFTILGMLITLLIWGLIFWLLWWLVGVAGLPEPFSKAAMVILAIASIFVVIGILTGSIASFPFLTGLR